MALVQTSFYANPLETSRLSQRELLARIFGHQEASEHAHGMDFEESFSDSGSDHEMEECNEGTVFVYYLFIVPFSTWETRGRFCPSAVEGFVL